MATKQKYNIVADEYIVGVFYYRSAPNCSPASASMRVACEIMPRVCSSLKVKTFFGSADFYDLEKLDTISYKVGRMSSDIVKFRDAIKGIPDPLNTVLFYVPARNVEDPSTQNIARLIIDDYESSTSCYIVDSLDHTAIRMRRDATVFLVIRTDRACSTTVQERQHLISDICSIAADAGCYYGYIQCEAVSDTRAGQLYGYTFNAPFTMHPIVRELAWWHPLTNRQNLARGVYWGNFFGPSFTQLLDKHGILQQLAEYQVRNPVKDMLVPGKQQVQRIASGSSFFSLTDDVLHSSNWLNDHLEVASKLNLPMVPCNARDRDDPYLMLAAWLHCKLRSIGALL